MYVLMLQSCTEIDSGISLLSITQLLLNTYLSRMFRPELIFGWLSSKQLTKRFALKYSDKYVRMYQQL